MGVNSSNAPSPICISSSSSNVLELEKILDVCLLYKEGRGKAAWKEEEKETGLVP